MSGWTDCCEHYWYVTVSVPIERGCPVGQEEKIGKVIPKRFPYPNKRGKLGN